MSVRPWNKDLSISHGRIKTVKTEYSEDELPLDPDFASALLEWKRKSADPTRFTGLELVFATQSSSNPRQASREEDNSQETEGRLNPSTLAPDSSGAALSPDRHTNRGGRTPFGFSRPSSRLAPAPARRLRGRTTFPLRASRLNVTKLIQISLQYVPLQVEGAASSFANDLDEAGQLQFVNMVRHRLAGDVVQRHQVAERDMPFVRGDLLENLHATRLCKHLGHVGKLLCGQPVL